MSTYLRSLDPVARERYTKRLDVLGLKEEDDPYAERNSHKFKDDLASWPSIEYGHIFCYFVQRPGLYTQQELMQWKSLEDISRVDLSVMSGCGPSTLINPDQCILHAYVNPSMRSPEKRHDAWVAMKECGTIITAHCKGMAG